VYLNELEKENPNNHCEPTQTHQVGWKSATGSAHAGNRIAQSRTHINQTQQKERLAQYQQNLHHSQIKR
jgi:hypothetical protein